MSSMQKQSSSSSGYGSGSGSAIGPRYMNVDERKRKRMISNRESARRSRMRKQKQLEDLVKEVSKLESENGEMREKIEVISRRYAEIVSANNVLTAQASELTDRLQSLDSVLQIAKEVSGLALDIPEIPDPLLKPWHLTCRGRSAVATSAGMFRG